MKVLNEPGENPYTSARTTITAGERLGFRPGSIIRQTPVQYFFNGGGLGDYINYSAAIVWLSENCPWILGTVFTPSFFVPLLRRILSGKLRWQVLPGEQITYDRSICKLAPELELNGTNISPQLLNATGAHLMDLGFAYYANKNAAPAGWTLPALNFSEEELPLQLRKLRGQYVVFTPGGVTPTRTVFGRHLNPIINFTVEQGLTPIFLGKSEIGGSVFPKFASDIDYGKGIDLRDKTDLLQAAAIMQHSLCVTGVDNGLLHLAALTDANIAFGYTITGPAFRGPRRRAGVTKNIEVARKKLPCINCQDHIKMLINHSFHSCLYGDTKCVDLLFEGQGEKWKLAISEFNKKP